MIAQQDAIDDQGPFCLFCDDLRQSNMVVDSEILRITAVFDLEFTNIMPAQYAQDVRLQSGCEIIRWKSSSSFSNLGCNNSSRQ